jgi:branched-chain amino acid transport system permease protein
VSGGILAVSSAEVSQAVVIGVITGAVYGLVALGLVLIYKSSGVFNFAQGEFGTVAVYTLYGATSLWELPYALALLVSLLAAGAMGLAVEGLIVRPLFDAPRVTLLVATAGVALLAIGIEIWRGEAKLRTVPPLSDETQRVKVLDVFISDQRLVILAVLIGLAILLALFFSRTNLGLAVLAASQEPTATELMGISVRRVSSFTWALAALLGGLAGVLSAPISQFGPGYLTGTALIPGFTAAVLGGMTSLPGAFVGGIVVGVAQSMASLSTFAELPGAGAVFVFGLLLVILLVRPQGLLGKGA